MRFVTYSLALVGLASSAQAAILINDIGLSSPDTSLTFSEVTLSSSAPVTTQFSSYGVTFSPTAYYDPQPGKLFPTAAIANYGMSSGLLSPTLSITFDQPQREFAIAAMTNNGVTTTFTALLGGTVVEQFSAATTFSLLPSLSHSHDFYGFTGITFDEIRIAPNNDHYIIMDNLQITVPEPSALAGLGVLGLLLRRRARA